MTDWPAAAAIAIRALAVMVAAGFVALVGVVLIAVIQSGAASLDVGDSVVTPFAFPLAYLGAFNGASVLLTGLVVLAFGLRVAMRSMALELTVADRTRVLALAAKVAVVAVAIMLVVGIVIDVLNLVPSGQPGAPLGLGRSFGVDYVRVVFLLGPIVAVAAFFALVRRLEVPTLTMLGLPGRMPAVVSSSWTGVRRTLRLALPGLLILYAVGTLLELLTADFGDAERLAGALIGLVIFSVVLTAVDVAASFFISAMSFLQFQAFGAVSAWQWAGVALVAVAFFLGGRAAAEAARPSTTAEAVTGASLLGVLIAGLGALVAIDYSGIGSADGVAAPAILLPLLWTLPALAGAWFYANEHNLPSGVVVAGATSGDEPTDVGTPAPPSPAPTPPLESSPPPAAPAPPTVPPPRPPGPPPPPPAPGTDRPREEPGSDQGPGHPPPGTAPR